MVGVGLSHFTARFHGVLLNRWLDSNSNAASGFLSVLIFDGAGNVSGSYTLVLNDCSVVTGTMTGTYSGNTDGSKTVILTFDVGGTITAMAVTDGGAGLQLLMTGGSLLQPVK